MDWEEDEWGVWDDEEWEVYEEAQWSRMVWVNDYLTPLDSASFSD
jgi:hypothetical protein